MNPILGYGFVLLGFAFFIAIIKIQYESMRERKKQRDQDNGFKQKGATKAPSCNNEL